MFANPIRDMLPDIFYGENSLSDYICDTYKGDCSPTLVSMILLSSRNIPKRAASNRNGRYIKNLAVNAAAYGYTEQTFFIEQFLRTPSFRIDSRFDELRIISLQNGTKEQYDSAFNIFEKHYTEYTEAYRLENVEQYLHSQRRIRSLVFHCEATNSTMVVIERSNYSKLHLILSAFPALLPALFKNEPVTDWERKFLKTLAGRDDTEFVAMVKEWLANNDLRERILTRQLKAFASGRIDNQKKVISAELDRIDERIQSHEIDLNELYKKRETKTAILLGLATMTDNGSDDELLDFFKSNKELNLISASDSRMVFEVKTALANYDPEAFEAYVRSARSELYCETNYYGYSVDDGVAMMKAIFDTNRFKVMMRGKFLLDYNHLDFDILRDYSGFLDDTVPNPHLTEYKCPGNNGQLISDAVRHYDYIMAVTYCIAVTANLNFAEPHNVSNFMRHLFCEARNTKCIVDTKTGEVITVDEAIKSMKEGE